MTAGRGVVVLLGILFTVCGSANGQDPPSGILTEIGIDQKLGRVAKRLLTERATSIAKEGEDIGRLVRLHPHRAEVVALRIHQHMPGLAELTARDRFGPRRRQTMEGSVAKGDERTCHGSRRVVRVRRQIDLGRHRPHESARGVEVGHTVGALIHHPETVAEEPESVRRVELAGSVGYSEHELLEKWARDSKILDIFEGTQQIQQLIVARRLLDLTSTDVR